MAEARLLTEVVAPESALAQLARDLLTDLGEAAVFGAGDSLKQIAAEAAPTLQWGGCLNEKNRG